ncbi:MAG: ChaB family protein [Leptolyngbya sp. BL-A-14]
MAYLTNQDLPNNIRDRLSDASQSLYRVAFNSAIQWYGEEAKAHKIAWNAVRNQTFSLNSAIPRDIAVLELANFS